MLNCNAHFIVPHAIFVIRKKLNVHEISLLYNQIRNKIAKSDIICVSVIILDIEGCAPIL